MFWLDNCNLEGVEDVTQRAPSQFYSPVTVAHQNVVTSMSDAANGTARHWIYVPVFCEREEAGAPHNVIETIDADRSLFT